MTAIEFAFVALPFFLLIFAIVEAGIAFAAQQLLVHAANEVARDIRTGVLRPADIDTESLHRRVCDEVGILMPENCPELVIDLRSFSTFQELAEVRFRIAGDGASRDIDTSEFRIAPGGSGSKNLLRLFYRWPIHVDLLQRLTANVKGDKTLLFAGAAWQNEPYRD